MADRKAELRKVLEKHFDVDAATGLADRIQNACSKGARLWYRETADNGYLILLDDEAIIATLTLGEAVLLCADVNDALTE